MNAETPPAQPPQPPAPGKRRKVSQVRVMVLLTLFFIAGILVYTVLPEGPVRGIGMTLVSAGMLWSLFRFGI